MSFNQNKYIADYNKKTYHMVPFRIRKDNLPVLDKLAQVPNKNRYILRLIEEDIEASVLTIKQIKEIILPILAQHHIYEVYLFGSYARGEASRDSDVDIYCENGNIKGLIDHGFLEEKLEKALGKEVDLLFFNTTMSDFLKANMEKDLIKLC